MNYITEINNFYDWLETNSISKSAISLWHALMHINNKANWVGEFSVAISVLEFKTGFKRSELFEARKTLINKGRLKCEQRGGNLSATYQLIPFSVRDVNTGNLEDNNSVHNMDSNTYSKFAQKFTISKLNKIEIKQERIDTEKTLIYPYNSISFLDLWDELLSLPNWISKNNIELQVELDQLSKYDEPTALLLIEYTAAMGLNNIQATESKTNILSKQNQIRKSTKTNKLTKINHFTPPSLEDVQAYCIERENNIDGHKFMNYYESNGWMVGKNRMKDWRAAIRTWEQNQNSRACYVHPVAQFNNPQKLADDDRW